MSEPTYLEGDKDWINPEHYKLPGGTEVYDIIEEILERDLGIADTTHHDIGCVIKYMLRLGTKGDVLEQLKKAHWYLSEAVQREEARRDEGQTKKDTVAPKGIVDTSQYQDWIKRCSDRSSFKGAKDLRKHGGTE